MTEIENLQTDVTFTRETLEDRIASAMKEYFVKREEERWGIAEAETPVETIKIDIADLV